MAIFTMAKRNLTLYGLTSLCMSNQLAYVTVHALIVQNRFDFRKRVLKHGA